MGLGAKDYKKARHCTLCGKCAETVRDVCEECADFSKLRGTNFLARSPSLIIP